MFETNVTPKYVHGSTLDQRLGSTEPCTAYLWSATNSIPRSKAGLLAATQETGIVLDRSQVTPAGPLRDE